MTKRENFAEIRAIVEKAGRADLVAFCDHETELLLFLRLGFRHFDDLTIFPK